MAEKKVLMLVGDFVEDYEVMVPFQMLQMVGHTIHAVSPGRKSGEQIKTAIHDFEGDQTYTEKRGHNFTLNATFDEINAQDYDGLMIPGGRAPEYIRLDKKVIEIVKHFAQNNKPIAAICHGPMVLTTADVISNVKCTAYPTVGPDIKQAGGIWVEVAETYDNVCVDKNIVTSPAWVGHPAWVRAFLELLGTKITL